MQINISSQLELDIFSNINVAQQEKIALPPKKYQKRKIENIKSEKDNLLQSLEKEFKIVKYIPLAQVFEKHGAFYALNYAQEQLVLAKRLYKNNSTLYIAVDRWQGSFNFADYLELIRELVESASQFGMFKIIGPTTAEILNIIGGRSETTCHLSRIQAVLQELINNGINELSGGADLIIHKVATEIKFSVSVSHRINLEEIEQMEFNYFPQTFFRDLLFIKNHLSQDNLCKSWFLWCGKRLASFSTEKQKALFPKLLRLLSIARILLPQNIVIRSSISSHGLPFVKEAIDIGASNCEYIGLDQNSAMNLGVFTKQEIEQQIYKDMAVTASG